MKIVVFILALLLCAAVHAGSYKDLKPGEWIEKKGAPMVYGITLPKNSPNKEGGRAFLSFILGPEGQEIMKKNGQPEIVPPRVDNPEKLPEALKAFFN